jgi:zinc protease
LLFAAALLWLRSGRRRPIDASGRPMRRLLPCAWLIASLSIAQTASADEPKIAYETFALPNGMKVYVIEDHRSPMVYEVIWFKVGSKDEVAHRTGFAHLFEHLMFKGSAHLPDGLMDRLLETGGGAANGSTSGDMTVYKNAASASLLETMLWIDADRLAGLTDTLDQAKLDNQRDVVLNERRQRVENQPYGFAQLMILDKLWPADHGYHWSTIGEAADLRAAALPDVTAFFKKYYVPNNATMVIAGDVQPAEARRMVEKYFAWIPRAPEPARPHYQVPPALTAQVSLTATDDVKAPRVYLTWRAPGEFAASESALALAAAVLGGGKTSRLYRRLVYGEKIAQDVRAGLDQHELGDTFQIVATAKPGTDPQRLIQEITEEIAGLAAHDPEPAELERAQAGYEAAFLHGLEPVPQRALLLAEYDVLAHDPGYLVKDVVRFRAVTAAQIKDAAARYLAPSGRVVLTITPGAKPQEAP